MNSTFSTLSLPLINNFTIINVESWFIFIDILAILCINLVIIFSTIFLFVIILDKTCHTVSMMLIGNSCLIALIAGCCILSLYIFTLQNDFKQIQYEDSLCVFRGYTAYVSCALFNFSFLLQALYRYVTAVYPTHLFCQSIRFQFILIVITWIFSCVYPFVFTFTGEIIYNVDNQICQLPFRLSFSIIYVVHCAYIIPVFTIIFIYFKLVRYVHEISKRIIPVNTLFRAQRELKMVQRTVIIITILIILCFPYALFILMSFFTNPPKYHFRIAYIFADVSLVCVMIAIFQFTDPLKTSIMKRINGASNMVAEAALT